MSSFAEGEGRWGLPGGNWQNRLSFGICQFIFPIKSVDELAAMLDADHNGIISTPLRERMETSMRQVCIVSVAYMIGAFAVFAPQNVTLRAHQSTHNIHVHGQASMNLTIDDNLVEVELEAPGADLVGFEHRPRTRAQINAVKAAQAKLLQARNVVKLSDAANCRISTAKLEDTGDAQKAAVTNDTVDDHSDFHVTYEFTCAEPSRLREILFTYFKSFPRASSINVNAIGRTAKRLKATVAAPQIKLDSLR